jgi:hypothetical protein
VSGERFELVVRALPGGGPVEARLRRALKVLLRAFGFRCERAVELPPAMKEVGDAVAEKR